MKQSIQTRPVGILLSIALVCLFGRETVATEKPQPDETAAYSVKPLSKEQAAEYDLAESFYRKTTMAEGILIATSEQVSDLAHREAAYQFWLGMQRISSPIAVRSREMKVLGILIAHKELSAQLPHLVSKTTGTAPAYYNLRKPGLLTLHCVRH
ncbi:MAG: hypothetical protein H8E37_06660, partial [Planctomycetes bacterium]|nr:hypothetical protein [Planctomycetota bacterium]